MEDEATRAKKRHKSRHDQDADDPAALHPTMPHSEQKVLPQELAPDDASSASADDELDDFDVEGERQLQALVAAVLPVFGHEQNLAALVAQYCRPGPFKGALVGKLQVDPEGKLVACSFKNMAMVPAAGDAEPDRIIVAFTDFKLGSGLQVVQVGTRHGDEGSHLETGARSTCPINAAGRFSSPPVLFLPKLRRVVELKPFGMSKLLDLNGQVQEHRVRAARPSRGSGRHTHTDGGPQFADVSFSTLGRSCAVHPKTGEIYVFTQADGPDRTITVFDSRFQRIERELTFEDPEDDCADEDEDDYYGPEYDGSTLEFDPNGDELLVAVNVVQGRAELPWCYDPRTGRHGTNLLHRPTDRRGAPQYRCAGLPQGPCLAVTPGLASPGHRWT